MDDITLVTIALMVAGLVGCVVPVLPGPPLVWLGTLYYGWRTEFEVVSPWLVSVLLIVALVGATADWWMGFLGAKQGGASVWGQLAALAGAIVGLIVLSLPGMIIGALVALGTVEWYRHREWKNVVRAGSGYLVGYLLSMVVEFLCSLVIIGTFGARLLLAAR